MKYFTNINYLSNGGIRVRIRLLILMISIIGTFGVNTTYGTDLVISRIFLPGDSVFAGVPFSIKFEIKNQNVQPAFSYLTKIRITDTNGDQFFSLDTTGAPIEPFTTNVMTLQDRVTLSYSGSYNLKLIVDFDQEINRSNDTIIKSFDAYDTLPPMDFSSLLNFNHYINPKIPDYHYGSMTITYPPYPDWKYLNTFFTTDTSNPNKTDWGIKNSLLPSKSDTNTFSISVSLDFLGSGFKLSDKLYGYTYIADTPTVSVLDEIEWEPMTFKVDTLDISNGFKVETETPATQFTHTPPTQTRAPVRDSVYRGCSVPNLDLNYTVYNSGTINGYAGDKNACGPTAAANSMQWLEEQFPMINSGISHRLKLYELSRMMNRPQNEGVWLREFIEGKLAFINKYQLPIKVKFQVLNLNSDVESPDRIENDAINKGDGSHPTWDFLKKEMKDEEDVEMFIEYHEKIGDEDKVTGRHVVTASGVADGAGNKTLWYKDDSRQGLEGYNTEKQVTWDTLSNGTPIIGGTFTSGDTTWYDSIFGIVSESYDSTVVFKEKGTLQRMWDGFKGFGRWITGGDIVEIGASREEYMNVLARVHKDSAATWIVRNYPLFPSNIDSLRTPFFDLRFQGINPSANLASLQAKIIYSDSVLTSKPFVGLNEWFVYTAGNNNESFGNSSFDNSGKTFPIDFNTNNYPAYSANSPEIRDSVWFNLFSNMIDLDSSSYNKASVSGYAGDASAAGAATFASIAGFLDERFTQINTNLNLRDMLYSISSLSSRQDNQGAERTGLVRAFLNFIDDNKVPVGLEFQSIATDSGNILSDRSFGHFAINRTAANSATDVSWLLSEMTDGRLPAIELGWYDKDKRLFGTWALVSGIFRQKDVTKLRLLFDTDNNAQGGISSSFVTMNETGGKYEYLVELSEPGIKCLVESYVTAGYDASIVFTGVEDEFLNKSNLLSISPNPVSVGSDLEITAGIPSDGHLKIEIFDLLGNKFAEIYNGIHQHGLAEFKFKIEDSMPKGVYIISMNGHGFFAKAKAIVQ